MHRASRVSHPSQRGQLQFLIADLIGQRQQIAALAKQTAALQARARGLLAVSSTLAAGIAQSSASCAKAYLAFTEVAATLPLDRRAGWIHDPAPRKDSDARAVEDSTELLEALQHATELLRMEFLDTEGSGRDTLAKCETALRRRRTSCTIELLLY